MSASTRYALIVAFGGFIFGFDAAVISGVVPFVSKLWSLNDFQTGLSVSIPTLGVLIAACCVTPLSDRFGRKPLLILIALLYAVSAAFSTFAPNFIALTVARFIGGIGFGSLILVPLYISEIAPAEKRGQLVSLNQLNIVIGLSSAFFCNYFIVNAIENPQPWMIDFGMTSHPWRWMLGLELVPASLYFLLLFFIPESPRWLRMKGDVQKANKNHARLFDEPVADALVETATGTHGQSVMEPLKKRLKSLLSKRMRLVLFIGLLIAIAQQITGINAIFFYAPTIFEQSGVGTNTAFAQAIWIGLINIVFTIVAMLLIDRFGRKPLLIIGLSGVALSMLLCSFQFHTARYQLSEQSISEIKSISPETLKSLIGIQYKNDTQFKNALAATLGKETAKNNESALIKAAIQFNATAFLIGICVFVASFAMSLGPVMWVILPEIFPNSLRALGMALTGATNTLVSFCVQFLFPWELSTFGASLTFLLYAIFAIIAGAFICIYLPETKGKTLEEIERKLIR